MMVRGGRGERWESGLLVEVVRLGGENDGVEGWCWTCDYSSRHPLKVQLVLSFSFHASQSLTTVAISVTTRPSLSAILPAPSATRFRGFWTKTTMPCTTVLRWPSPRANISLCGLCSLKVWTKEFLERRS